MTPFKQALAIFATTAGLLFLFFLILRFAFIVIGGLLALPGLLLLMLSVYGWMIYAFVQYREGRQEEFTYLLQSAAEAQAPLAPVIRSYLADRPHGMLREFWVFLLLFFVFPGYYFFWHRQHTYDRRVCLLVGCIIIARIGPNLCRDAACKATRRRFPGDDPG